MEYQPGASAMARAAFTPATAVALFDADNEFLPLLSQATVGGAPAAAVHGDSRNVLYFDGHVASVNKDINPQEKL